MHACSIAQSCLTLQEPVDCSLPGSYGCGISQARILEWVVMSSSRGSAQPRDWTCISWVFSIGRRIPYHCITWQVPRYQQELPSHYVDWCVTSVSTSYNSPHLFPPSHTASLLSFHKHGRSLLRAYVLVLLPRVPPPDIYLACSLTSFKYLLKCHFLSEGNGKPLQYSCLENPINSMNRQKDRTLKDGNSPGR